MLGHAELPAERPIFGRPVGVRSNKRLLGDERAEVSLDLTVPSCETSAGESWSCVRWIVEDSDDF